MRYSEEMIEKALKQSLANVNLEEDAVLIDENKIKNLILGEEKNGGMGRLSLTRDKCLKK
ncbi:MAG: hypothetical protein IJB71_00105 [Bacilli bacterium]|nr:hypothetical protein [Bacilli bacterium]